MTGDDRMGSLPGAPGPAGFLVFGALSVSDLDAWVAKLLAENVKFLEQPYKLGDTRAVIHEKLPECAGTLAPSRARPQGLVRLPARLMTRPQECPP